jgi:hypothetical protein
MSLIPNSTEKCPVAAVLILYEDRNYKDNRCFCNHVHAPKQIVKVCTKKVKQPHYRPGHALRVPEG